METDDGGWTLVASNSGKDDRFPTGKNRCGLFLHKPGYNQNPSIKRDYLIGPQINELKYTEGRVMVADEIGGRTATLDMKMPINSGTNKERLSNNVKTLKAIGDNDQTVAGCGHAPHCNLDGQWAEMHSGGCNSNLNQRTIGFVCTGGSPDPSSGTYVGHGSNEINFPGEGLYFFPIKDDGSNDSCASNDFYTYTTWVR